MFSKMWIVVVLVVAVLLLPAVASAGTITIRGSFSTDYDGMSHPLVNARVVLMDDDTIEDETVATTYANPDGSFSFTVNNDDGFWQGGRDPYVIVYCDNGAAIGRTATGSAYATKLPKAGDNVPSGFTYDYGPRKVTWAEVFVAVRCVGRMQSDVSFQTSPGWYRSKVGVKWPVTGWPRSDGNTIYLPQLPAPDPTRLGDIVYHEYAHCILYALYGGSPPAASGLYGTDPAAESTPGLAIVEGWADYADGTYRYDQESNHWCDVLDTGDMDGEVVEGAAVSIFRDIADGIDPAEPDLIQVRLPFNDIFTVMRLDKPQSMGQFYSAFATRWPALAGPLCSIYWHSGIDQDIFPPYGGVPPISLTSPANVPGWTKTTTVTATLKADDSGSGVKWMRLHNEGGSWSAFVAYVPSMSWTLPAGDGVKKVYAQFRDGKGLLSPAYAATITLDQKSPTGSISVNGGGALTTSTAVKLGLPASDAAGCGVARMKLWNEGGAAAWKPYAATAAWTLPAGAGTRRVYVQYADRLGNLSPVYADAIELRTATSLTATTKAVVLYGAKSTLTGTLKAAGSGLAGKSVALQVSANGTTWATAATTTTAAGGAFTLVSAPLTQARSLRVRFAGDATYAASVSASLAVKPQVRLTAPTAPLTASVGSAFMSEGDLAPRHAAGTKPVQVQCFHHEKKADGSYGYVFKTSVAALAFDQLTSTRYVASISLPSAGKWAIRAYHPLDALNAATYSTWRYLSVQ